jgi:hypothetical protein
MKKNNIGLILIQIEEAHTKKWPLGFLDHPENHNTFENRVSRANEFVKRFTKFENVYIDGWNNIFEETFQAWPDRFVLVDKDLKILEKSEYSFNAVIFNDYADIIQSMI